MLLQARDDVLLLHWSTTWKRFHRSFLCLSRSNFNLVLVLLHDDRVLVVGKFLSCLPLLLVFLFKELSQVVKLLPDPLLRVEQQGAVITLTLLHVGGRACILVCLNTRLRHLLVL